MSATRPGRLARIILVGWLLFAHLNDRFAAGFEYGTGTEQGISHRCRIALPLRRKEAFEDSIQQPKKTHAGRNAAEPAGQIQNGWY